MAHMTCCLCKRPFATMREVRLEEEPGDPNSQHASDIPVCQQHADAHWRDLDGLHTKAGGVVVHKPA